MTERTESSADQQRRLKAFRAYLLMLAGLLAALLVAGYLPTRRLAGDGGLFAMIAGCVASLVGSLVSSWWLRVRSATVAIGNVVTLILGSLAVRLAVTVVLGVALALSGLFALRPLLLWLAASHAALLVADTKYALAVAGQLAVSEKTKSESAAPRSAN